MTCWVVVCALLLAAAGVQAAQPSWFDWVARRSADSSSTPVKRYEDDASSGRIWCKGCRYPASTTRQCEGGFEQCQPGEVCATKIPDHPSATDGCVEANACKILSDLGVFSSCCAHDFCNLLKVRSGD